MYERHKIRPLRRQHTPYPVQSWTLEPHPNASVLIGVTSCELYERKGWNDPMRQTWLAEAKVLGIDYKFFHGHGSTIKNDILILECGDGYASSSEKLQGKAKWMLFQGYDYLFTCLADCYAVPERLLSSDFRKYDYFGNFSQHPGGTPYAQGGPGFFLSRKACKILADTRTVYPNDDCWAADQLYGHNLAYGHCDLLRWQGHEPGNSPLKTNNIITAHLSNAAGGYQPELMLQKHREWTQ